MQFKNIEKVKVAVDNNGGILTVEMSSLRDAYGAGKLGVNVVAAISEELSSYGVRHWPQSLPAKQWESVRLYKAGSPLSKIIELLDNYEDGVDERLIEITTDNAREKIDQVRKILG